MFRVKICGITTAKDALMAIESGADCIGLNFFEKSQRFVTPKRAKAIADALPAAAKTVGVFVNAPAAEIRQIAAFLSLDAVQLHGDEPPELIADLAGVEVVRAFRFDSQGWEPCRRYLDHCRSLGAFPAAILIDGFRKGEFGGTGTPADWAVVARYRELGIGVPLLLAGGLTHENVAAAIAAVRPDGVDTASGVESAPGVKDAAKVAAFVNAARQQFADWS